MSGMLSKIKNGIIALGRFFHQPTNAFWVMLGALAFCFVWALLADKSGAVARLLEINNKAEVLRLIGWGMSGVLAAIVAVGLNRRAAAMDKQNDLTEKGHIDERFKVAVQGLAGEQPSVRIAAFYQFYYLAKDNPDMGFRSSIFDILCAHLRQITSDADYRENVGNKKPTEECQSLLDVLFKKSRNVFSGMAADMKNAYLVGANLSTAELQQADFRDANVSDANFWNANVSKADFDHANVSDAFFARADVSEARFWGANVSEANFQHANVSAAFFGEANLSGGEFGRANVSGAKFWEANVSGARFWGANLSATDFTMANVSEAHFGNANVSKANFEKADMSAAKFFGANVSEANFEEANVSKANFWSANVSEANFESADVSEAKFKQADLRSVDFSSAKGIDSANFSDIKIDAETKFPEGFREGEHYTVAKEEE